VSGKFDVLIVGAGPAGVTTAICLGNSGLKVAVIDKACFPREKICGDGLTLDVINQLFLISPRLYAAFMDFNSKLPCSGAEIFSPSLDRFSLGVRPDSEKKPMFTCRRIDFDDFMFGELKQYENVCTFENCIPLKIIHAGDSIILDTNQGRFEGSILVGADGVNSFVAREMGVKHITKEQQCVALRTYYRGLKPLSEGSAIEMYLAKEILPGYLWIFHLADGSSNVGLGMPAKVIKRKGIKLKKCFEGLLMSEPLKSRLAGAERTDAVRGRIIPMGGQKRDISGNRFILTGDAASLVDPITGEGVGNAIRSGRVAGKHIIRCFKSADFSGAANKAYDAEIYRRMKNEFRFHLSLQKLLYYPGLLNYILGSAANYPEVELSLKQLIWNLHSGAIFSRILLVFRLIYLFTFQRLFASRNRPKKGFSQQVS